VSSAKAIESSSRASRALIGLACLAWSSCQGSVQSAKTEDEARLMVPVPICVKRLPRSAAPGAIVSLSPNEYWSLLLPSFDDAAKTLDPSGEDCSGRRSLASLSPQGVDRMTVDPDKLTLAAAADGMKVLWLQSHAMDDNTSSGLLALIRQLDSYLEVYAVGTHRGRPLGTQFTLERMGPRLVINALEEDCSGEGQERRCRATSSVYLMGTGALAAAATYPIEQIASASAPGGLGMLEYRFSASADYRADAIALTEHLSVRSKGQGEIRSSDLERAFHLKDGQLIASGESLWTKTLTELGDRRQD
jgi:hypothetical protein